MERGEIGIGKLVTEEAQGLLRCLCSRHLYLGNHTVITPLMTTLHKSVYNVYIFEEYKCLQEIRYGHMKQIAGRGKLQDDRLHFLINDNGFTVEIRGDLPEDDEKLAYWYGKFREDRYQTLYNMGFNEKPGCLDAAGSFLYLLSDSYQKYILSRPELEIARDGLALDLEEDILDRLLRSVPFAPGSEYIDGDWIRRQFDILHDIFCREISAYDGSVALYLADKSQHLRVPERVFFHLVENHDDDEFPFAFLATYSTRLRGKKIVHKPLHYAMTEYKGDRDKLMILLSCLTAWQLGERDKEVHAKA